MDVSLGFTDNNFECDIKSMDSYKWEWEGPLILFKAIGLISLTKNAIKKEAESSQLKTVIFFTPFIQQSICRYNITIPKLIRIRFPFLKMLGCSKRFTQISAQQSEIRTLAWIATEICNIKQNILKIIKITLMQQKKVPSESQKKGLERLPAIIIRKEEIKLNKQKIVTNQLLSEVQLNKYYTLLYIIGIFCEFHKEAQKDRISVQFNKKDSNQSIDDFY